MTSDRPYRKALSWNEVWDLLWGGAGTQWDEQLVRTFAAVMSEEQGVAPSAADPASALHRPPLAARSRR